MRLKQNLQLQVHRNHFMRSILLAVILFVSFLIPFNAFAQNIQDLYGQAVDAYNTKHFDQATELYQQLIKIVPHFAAAYNGLALVLQEQGGDEDKIIENLKSAVSYDPRMATAYENLGKIYYNRQEFDSALENFEKALRIDSSLLTSKLSLAWIYLQYKSNPSKALKYFKQVVGVVQNPNIYFGMGMAYFADNQRSKAMDMVTKLHSLGQEELASRLEKSLRENRWVNTQTNNSDSNSNKPVAGQEIDPTQDAPTGVQVRLRGKLSDY